MRCTHLLRNALFAGAVLATMPGCLSLGGKTVYSSETPQTSERLSALEARVGVLEQVIAGKTAPASRPPIEPVH